MHKTNLSFRPISSSEHSLALDLWGNVFDVGRDYFLRYYDCDPWYEVGDTFGAWTDDGILASAVHICRRCLYVGLNRSILCGGIANVATRPQYRKMGLSGQLLTLANEHMAERDFGFSLLWTGVPHHYSRYGWQSVEVKSYQLDIEDSILMGSYDDTVERPTLDGLREIYVCSPRKLQVNRSSEYFGQWPYKEWLKPNKHIVHLPGVGYAVFEAGSKADTNKPARIEEFRAVGKEQEQLLLNTVIRHVAKTSNQVELPGQPQFFKISDIPGLSNCSVHINTGGMVRNNCLTADEFKQVIDAFESGDAIWWAGDGF